MFLPPFSKNFALLLSYVTYRTGSTRSPTKMPHPSPKPSVRPNSRQRNSSAFQNRSMTNLEGSRGSSRGRHAFNGSKTDLFSKGSSKATINLADANGATTRMLGSSFRPHGVRRWDGNKRTTTDWDCLRRVSQFGVFYYGLRTFVLMFPVL